MYQMGRIVLPISIPMARIATRRLGRGVYVRQRVDGVEGWSTEAPERSVTSLTPWIDGDGPEAQHWSNNRRDVYPVGVPKSVEIVESVDGP